MRRKLSNVSVVKKLDSPAVNSTGSKVLGKLLRIDCRLTNYQFLIDTGSIVSVIPARSFRNLKEPDGQLHAANGSTILTYGTKTMNINIGLGIVYEAEFIIADVTQAIIGADFLARHNITVNMKAGRIESENKAINCVRQTPPAVYSVLNTDDPRVIKLLSTYPSLSKVPDVYPEPKHDFVHRIPTKNGELPYCRPRNLPPKMLKIARDEFEKMEKQGIVSRASSNCASPIHIVPKKDSPDSHIA